MFYICTYIKYVNISLTFNRFNIKFTIIKIFSIERNDKKYFLYIYIIYLHLFSLCNESSFFFEVLDCLKFSSLFYEIYMK